MRAILVLVGLSSAILPAEAQQLLVPSAGLVITESVRFAPGEYHLPADSAGAILIQGEGIDVDFTGVTLIGSAEDADPDQFKGVALRVSGGSGITVHGVTVRGYKVGLLATGTPKLVVTDSDFSYNWKQRLKSTIEREHIDDWMSYHTNENDEWLRYGAAVYLRDCRDCRIQRVTVTGGQNGLLLTEVNDGVFIDNTITFNSSLGIGLYRSSRNRVSFNRLDFNVRGYSHGIYNRGQDSAAILIYEQSNDNEFSYNSATHSGDGLFLWAGQTTMDTGEGGCNGNLIFRNDFSFAPTNGIEITFSSNRVLDNYIEGCWHGIWGGYSFDTEIEGNTFVDNEEHIAIEHGQDIRIERNTFTGGDIGLRLWERDSQPADWGYAERRDVRSRDYWIARNEFDGVATPIEASRTQGLTVRKNVFGDSGALSIEESPGVRMIDNAFSGESAVDEPGVRRPFRAALTRTHPRDRAYILVDEWGPHDFRSPVLWPRSPRQSAEQWFEVVGPPGEWQITGLSGVDSVSARSGAVGDSIRVWRSHGDVVDMRIEAEYVGKEVTDRRGRKTAAGTPYRFEYAYFFVPIAWKVDFFAYTEETDPRSEPGAFAQLLEGTAAFHESTSDLGYQWYGEPAPGLPRDHFATRSQGTLTAPEGRYALDLTSDDGVRVWVDGRLVHDDWTYHAPRQARIELELGGQHRIEIWHFEIAGYATLVASLVRLD
jgi:parallel beta-helix repeat protein